MKIEKLTIENFKCFKREKTFDLSRLTILTGANSSGKSSVIQAILMLLQSENFPYEISTNGDYVQLRDFKGIVHKNSESNFIKLNVVLVSGENSSLDNNKYEIISTFEKNPSNGLLKSVYPIPETNLIGNTSIHDANYRFTLNENIKEVFRLFRTQYSNYISAFRHSPKSVYLEKNKVEFKIGIEGEGYIEQIVEWEARSNSKLVELIKIMKNLELIESIKINRVGGSMLEVLVKPTNSGIATSITNVGSGVGAFMPILVADLQLPNNSTLFLEEPEIHLHPSVQAKYIDYIIHKINTTEKNYVIETHSEYFLNRLRLAIVKGELKKEDLKVYFLENNSEDTEVYDINFTKTGAIKNAPKTYFKTYMSDNMDIALHAFAE